MHSHHCAHDKLSFITLTATSSLQNDHSNDILYIKDWIFNFNLENAGDWNREYSITNTPGISRRRTLWDYFDDEAMNYDELYDEDSGYSYDHQYLDAESFTNELSGSARSCTSSIPGISRSLCVHWADGDGFRFSFQNGVSAARTAKDAYSELDHKDVSFNDDNQWDEVDLVQNMLNRALDSDLLYEQMMEAYHDYGMSL